MSVGKFSTQFTVNGEEPSQSCLLTIERVSEHYSLPMEKLGAPFTVNGGRILSVLFIVKVERTLVPHLLLKWKTEPATCTWGFLEVSELYRKENWSSIEGRDVIYRIIRWKGVGNGRGIMEKPSDLEQVSLVGGP